MSFYWLLVGLLKKHTHIILLFSKPLVRNSTTESRGIWLRLHVNIWIRKTARLKVMINKVYSGCEKRLSNVSLERELTSSASIGFKCQEELIITGGEKACIHSCRLDI